jgi:hypothetical protein
MRHGFCVRVTRVTFPLLLLAALGCGGAETTPPKSAAELSEQEKQQVRELNEQRASEWGTPKGK